jgi:hypothetical protein
MMPIDEDDDGSLQQTTTRSSFITTTRGIVRFTNHTNHDNLLLSLFVLGVSRTLSPQKKCFVKVVSTSTS